MEIKIFQKDEFGTIRTAEVNGEPWFVGKDVAEVLGYTNPQKAIRDHVDAEDKTVNESFSVNGTAIVLINESGLYSLILSSKLPTAKQFKRWVTSEVLPAIRKNGGYIHTSSEDTPDVIMAKALLLAQKTIEDKNTLIASQKKTIEKQLPKALFADAVSASNTSILVGELAKILKQNGAEMGQKRLFDWLRTNGYLIKGGSSYNMPTQRSMEQGLFEIKETVVTHSNGHTTVTRTPKVTGKGQVYFVNKFLNNKNNEPLY